MTRIGGPRPPAMLPVPGQQPSRPMFRSLAIASSGIAAQRQRMETIAQNVANADVTRGPDGQPYRRRTVLMEATNANDAVLGAVEATMQDLGVAGANAFGAGVAGVASANGIASGVAGANGVGSVSAGDDRRWIEVPVLPNPLPAVASAGTGVGSSGGVRVAGIAEDQGEGRLVYEPGHPDADTNGYVRYPDIDTTQELVHLLDAKRLYEANASVFQMAKSMLRAALDI